MKEDTAKHPLADTPEDINPFVRGFRVLAQDNHVVVFNSYYQLVMITVVQRAEDWSTREIVRPIALRPRDRSKYKPHQGKRESARRRGQARGYAAGQFHYPVVAS